MQTGTTHAKIHKGGVLVNVNKERCISWYVYSYTIKCREIADSGRKVGMTERLI
jgi:hypothetical protein